MQPGVRFRLTVRRGPQPNQQYELARDTLTIGRDITNDIVINDPEVSRHHVRFVSTGGGYTIEDLRSTNGTFVNRQRITGIHPLSNGDLIGLGETVLLAYEVVSLGEQTAVAGAGRIAPQPVPAPAPVPAPVPAPRAPAYAAPPPPQAMRPPVEEYYEEPEPDRNRWIVIGCGVLTLLFCCALVAAVIAVDYFNLYCDLPFGPQIFNCAP